MKIATVVLLVVMAVSCSSDDGDKQTDGAVTNNKTNNETNNNNKDCGLPAPVSKKQQSGSTTLLCEQDCVLSLAIQVGECPVNKATRLAGFDWDSPTQMGSMGFHLQLRDNEDYVVEASAGKLYEATGMGGRSCATEETKKLCNLVADMPLDEDITVKTTKFEITFQHAEATDTLTLSKFTSL